MGGSGSVVPALVLCLAVAGCGGSCDGRMKGGDAVVLKGTVRVTGNAPFTRLVLTVPSSEGGGRPADYLLQGPLADEMRNRYQGKVVTVEGVPCAEKPPDRLPCIEPERVLAVE